MLPSRASQARLTNQLLPTPAPINTTHTHPTHSASAFGGVMFIFMGLGFKAGYLGMHDPDLLPYSLCK